MQAEIKHQVYSSASERGSVAIEDQPKHDEQRRAPWRMILLASLGGALELYDFVVFGVFATAIAAAFFPTANPLVSQMLAYASFAIGYFARRVGGIVLGHFR